MTAAAEWRDWTCLVRVVVTDPAALDQARHVLEDLMGAVDIACSRFREDSELCAVDAAPGRWTYVSPLLEELLAVALEAARRTNGAVDPTVAVSLVGLGYDRAVHEIPSDAPTYPTPAPGWRSVELDRDLHRVRIPAGVHLDLGATAKAWTADTAAAEITARTGSGCLVSIGGDIAVAGPAPDRGWRVRVEDVTGRPGDPASGPATVVRLRAGGLATSSTVSRRWQRDGLSLHHVVDPLTGLPPTPHWRTVTAVADSCLLANTLTTAAIVRGADAWPALRAAGVPVRLVTVGGEVLTVGGWPASGAA